MAMDKRKRDSVVKAVNKKFPPSSPGYPIAFDVDDEVRISGESYCYFPEDKKREFPMMAIDYYNEYATAMGWDSDIHPAIEKYLASRGMYAEWYNPAYIVVYEI